MSEVAAGAPGFVAPTVNRIAPSRTWTRPDGLRMLQLVLATVWLLDGVLQLQSVFFTKTFGLQMISGMSSGNPSVVARPIDWSGGVIGHHAGATDAVFALAQIGIGLAIAWRPSMKIGLGVSIAWALAVWWIGEGLGGVLNGSADPVNGAPGAVILYGLLAVLLWPREQRGGKAPFLAAQAVGSQIAKGVWLLLWASLAYFAVIGGNRSPSGLHNWIDSERAGEPRWIAWMDGRAAILVEHKGVALAVVLSVLFLFIAVSTYLPRSFANGSIVVAITISVVLWVVGENFGALFTNGATDVNSAPMLILLSIAYWRASPRPLAIGATARDELREQGA